MLSPSDYLVKSCFKAQPQARAQNDAGEIPFHQNLYQQLITTHSPGLPCQEQQHRKFQIPFPQHTTQNDHLAEGGQQFDDLRFHRPEISRHFIIYKDKPRPL